MRRRLLAVMAGAGLALGTATGIGLAPAASAASVCTADGSLCVTAVELSTRTADLTRTPAPAVTTRVRVTSTSDVTGNDFYFFLSATTDTVADNGTGSLLSVPVSGFTRTSGTARDGWWTAPLALVPGTATTWQISGGLSNAAHAYLSLAPSELAAAGPVSITSTVSAVPGTPTGLKVTSEWYPTSGVIAVARWDRPAAGAVAASGWKVTTSGSCGSGTTILSDYLMGTGQIALKTARFGSGTCKVTVQAVNDRGLSAGSISGSAFIF